VVRDAGEHVIEQADVVVVGSGGMGAATAFHLATRGVKRVVLLDQYEIGSQTSPRAAGLVSCARKSELMCRLVKLAAEQIRQFTEETGQPLDWVRSGSLKVARRPQDAAVLEEDVKRGQRLGLDIRRVSAEEAHRLNPFLEPSGVLAAEFVGDDLYFDPPQVAVGFARAAADRGAVLVPGTRARRVLITNGRVTGVETDRGAIHTAVVVDAAGAWTRHFAELSGVRVPLVPTRHQLFVTEPLAGAIAELPIMRVMDAAVYVRPCAGGLLWGVFEEAPRFMDMSALGEHFQARDTPLDAETLWRAADDVQEQMPILRTAKVREHRGGVPTMTGDGEHILGPAPAAGGFFFASGCNVAGLSISPALGAMLAAWIVDGAPPMDLSPMAVERFGSGEWSEDRLRTDAAWQYRHFYGAP
jgi:4-methylaminobutanoate oxidase (formaldehyde-forming)